MAASPFGFPFNRPQSGGSAKPKKTTRGPQVVDLRAAFLDLLPQAVLAQREPAARHHLASHDSMCSLKRITVFFSLFFFWGGEGGCCFFCLFLLGVGLVVSSVPAGPIDTQMFARAFVANKCARNGKCKHMQTHRLRGGALALHTFWNCARVAENCASCGFVFCRALHQASRQPQKVLELDLSRKNARMPKTVWSTFLCIKGSSRLLFLFLLGRVIGKLKENQRFGGVPLVKKDTPKLQPVRTSCWKYDGAVYPI